MLDLKIKTNVFGISTVCNSKEQLDVFEKVWMQMAINILFVIFKHQSVTFNYLLYVVVLPRTCRHGKLVQYWIINNKFIGIFVWLLRAVNLFIFSNLNVILWDSI